MNASMCACMRVLSACPKTHTGQWRGPKIVCLRSFWNCAAGSQQVLSEHTLLYDTVALIFEYPGVQNWLQATQASLV